MSIKTKQRLNISAHTKEILQNVLEPKTLDELFAVVEGKFPFSAVKICETPGWSGGLKVGSVVTLVERKSTPDGTLYRYSGLGYYGALGQYRQWRLAE